MSRILRGLVGLLGATLLTATMVVLAPAPARAITFDIDWTGSNGWTLEGSFSYPDALIGTGPITGLDLTAFQIEVFSSGVLQGTWDRFVDGLNGFQFNFNFDTTAEAFFVGGSSNDPTGQEWNLFGPGGTCPNPGVGFASGDGGQVVCVNGVEVVASFVFIEDQTLTVTQQPTGVPLPATLLLVGAGLVGVVAWRRRVAP